MTRSGPTITGVAVAFALFVSDAASASCTALVTFACAMIQYWPGGVPGGIGTTLVTVAVPPPASSGTAASPSTVSPGTSSAGLVERYRRLVVAGGPARGAAPGRPPPAPLA